MHGQARITSTELSPSFATPRDTSPSAAIVAGSNARIGRFTVLRELGAGGMGVVYAAYDEQLDRRVAIKVLHAGRDDERAQQRMQREAQALARLSHPNVVQVYEVGMHAGAIFLAMEFVTGQTLGAWVREATRPRADVIDAYVQAGRGLAAAHAVGLVHRDFKPDNCMRAEDGRVRVLDFGLARQSTEAPVVIASTDPSFTQSLDQSLTRTGIAVGTPAYMAPEQFLGEELDARVDQFAFCVALWEALYGQRPFLGTTRIQLAEAVTAGRIAAPPPSKVPSELHAALVRGLARAPADRWPDMTALLDVLARDPGRRSRWIVAGGVALLGGAAIWWGARDEGPKCTGADALIADTWGPPQRAAITETFARSTKPFAEPTLHTVLADLDVYAQGWIASRTEACVATRERGDQSEDLLDHRIACLDRHARELAIVVELLAHADDGVIERAGQTIAALGSNERCDDTAALLARIPPAETPEAQAEAELIREEVFRVRALGEAAKYTEALDAAKVAAERAEALGYRPVLAEALVQLSYAQQNDGERAQAIATLHRAAQHAQASGDDRILGYTWVRLGWALAEEGERDAALRWLDYASSTIERRGGDVDMLIELLAARASAHYWVADHAATLAVSDELTALALRNGRPLSTKDALQRGNALLGLARWTEAKAILTTALDDTIAMYGAQHPTAGMLHNALGIAAYSEGDLPGAAQHFGEAFRIIATAVGPDHPDVLFSLGNLGEVQRMQGQYDAALRTMRDVLAIVERNFPPEHREVATTKHNLATILREQGDVAAALPLFDEALAMRERVHGNDHPYVANTLTERGLALVALAREAEAIAGLERAKTIRAANEPDVRATADTDFALARALLASDPTRARALATSARDALATLADDPIATHRRTEIDAWLGRP
ncbi:MAG TPA: serine/threonine-protein kinase [Nannocystaceae bacterium]|nr:serine/threonine-protein kinase [Nannocystaceae bacterium]